MAFRLFAICHADDQRHGLPDGASMVAVRELGAIVADAEFTAATPDDELLARHRRIVDAAFTQGEVVPVPPGTIFRNDAALQRWVELHYVALNDALSYVADRVGARIHLVGRDEAGHEVDSGTELSAAAAEMMRTLRRRAVAGVPLRREHTTGMLLAAAFLVERTLWREFESEVAAIRQHNPHTELAMTGPWPPYDFVQIEFGG